ncbi:hypothetical protein [Caenispirillum bisanense]|uniref:Uncharacterized protein n=1 Tax=Caenispirillum bisanense TaxID=414052 RepID=A0A286GUH3_9PROT|nr:hypothetical protein [Caenispirillum bisanense]SOD98759.1 hypothetical protein SAMN05421508_10875 [Caenispirillum bisanense]
MGASVISFRSLLGRGRSTESVPGPWTNQELAELYRIADLLGRAGMAVGTDSGVSDENEPWFVFFAPDSGDVIAHFARIGGVYIAVAAGQEKPLRGTCFRDLVQKIMDCEPLVFPQPRKRSGKVTNLYLHPMVVLTAFVATALLWSNKSMAATEGDADGVGRRAGKSGDAAPAAGSAVGSGLGGTSQAATGHGESGLPGGPNFLTAMAGQSTAVTFASAAALISTVLKTEEAAAGADSLRLAAPESRMVGLDGGLALTADDDAPSGAAPAAVETLGGEVRVTIAAGDGRVAFLLDGADVHSGTVTALPAAWDAASWAAAAAAFDPADQFSIGPAPVTPAVAAGVSGDGERSAFDVQPAPVPAPAQLVAVAEPAAPPPGGSSGASRVAAPSLTNAVTDGGDSSGRMMVDLRIDDVLLANRKGAYTQITFIVPTEAHLDTAPAGAAAVPEAATPTATTATADGTATTGSTGKATLPPPPPPPMTVDNRHDVVLGAGQQVIYFGGGNATVSGFVAGEDVLLVDPRLLADRWQASVPVDQGTAVLSFADGSQLVLHDLVLSAYLTGG